MLPCPAGGTPGLAGSWSRRGEPHFVDAGHHAAYALGGDGPHKPVVATGTTWLPKNAFVHYVSGLRRGGLPPIQVACQSDRDGAVSWSHAIDQQLFVTQLDAQASTMRTLNEGETI
jgi:hypothetical protein